MNTWWLGNCIFICLFIWETSQKSMHAGLKPSLKPSLTLWERVFRQDGQLLILELCLLFYYFNYFLSTM